MPVNDFRSWNDHPVFKGNQTDGDVAWLKINYFQLVANFRGNADARQLLAAHFCDADHRRNVRTLARLEFIYWCDRVRAVIDDHFRIFIDDDPGRIVAIYSNISIDLLRSMDRRDLEVLVDKAGNKLVSGSIEDISARMFKKFGIEIFCRREISILRYVFEVRNLLVHRGENIDLKFVNKTKSKKELGEPIAIPHRKTLSVTLKSLADSLPDRIACALRQRSKLRSKGAFNG